MGEWDLPGFNWSPYDFFKDDEEESLLSPALSPAPADTPSPVSSPEVYSNPLRDDRLKQIQDDLNTLSGRSNELQETINTVPSMSGDQLLANGVMSLLPMILGRALAGNTGGAIGGKVGLGMYETGEQAFLANEKAKQAKAELELKSLLEKEKGLRSEAGDLRKQAITDSSQRSLAQYRDSLADDNRREQQAAINARNDARDKERDQRGDAISAKPYNIDLYKDQKAINKMRHSTDRILETIARLDPKGDEDVAAAFARGVKAGVFKGGDEADLQRQIMVNAFNSLKTFFPGAISDQEREAALKALGGEKGVPLRAVAATLRRAVDNAISQYNDTQGAASQAYGDNILYKQLENPYSETATPASGGRPRREDYDLTTVGGKQKYLDALNAYKAGGK